MRASRTLRHGVLAVLVFILAACGGSNPVDPTIGLPTPSIAYPASFPATAVVILDGGGSTASSGRPLTYSWVLTSVPSGSKATITSPTSPQAFLKSDLVGNYTITLTVSDGLKSQSVSIVTSAVTFTAPVILSDLVEPVSGVVNLSLSSNEGSSVISWTADGAAIATGATVSWDTTNVPAGSHVVNAQVQSTANYYVNISRTFQVKQTTLSFTSQVISESLGKFGAVVGAQSANGIIRVDAYLDGVPIGSLATPNTCTDATGVACATTGINNGYFFSGTVGSGAHVLVLTATDGVYNTLSTQLRLNVTDVT